MPFVVTSQARAELTAKSAVPPHVAAAHAHEQHLAEQHGSAMAQHADKPPRDDDQANAEQDDDVGKASQRHPATGRYISDQIPSGASHVPIIEALALHQAPRPLASLATTPAVSLGSSIAPGEVTVTQLDYRQGIAPVMVNPSPERR